MEPQAEGGGHTLNQIVKELKGVHCMASPNAIAAMLDEMCTSEPIQAYRVGTDCYSLVAQKRPKPVVKTTFDEHRGWLATGFAMDAKARMDESTDRYSPSSPFYSDLSSPLAPPSSSSSSSSSSLTQPLRRSVLYPPIKAVASLYNIEKIVAWEARQENKTWRVVFSLGTVVTLPLAAPPSFKGYTPENYDFPAHRIDHSGGEKEIMNRNDQIWELQRTLGGSAGISLRQAYHLLVSDGYPYAGSEESDRGARLVGSSADGSSMYEVNWSARSPSIVGRVHFENWETSSTGVAIVIGGECRRYDYIGPMAVAVISPGGNVIRPAVL